jgi:four helix bundle protein
LETETQIRMAGRLHYLSEEQVARLLKLSAELGRILNGLIASI